MIGLIINPELLSPSGNLPSILHNVVVTYRRTGKRRQRCGNNASFHQCLSFPPQLCKLNVQLDETASPSGNSVPMYKRGLQLRFGKLFGTKPLIPATKYVLSSHRAGKILDFYLDGVVHDSRLDLCLDGVSLNSTRSFASAQLATFDPTFDDPLELLYESKRDFLQFCGLSREQASQILKQCPQLLAVNLEQELQPTIAFFKAIGVNNLAKVFLSSPNLFVGRVEKTLAHKIEFFESFGIERKSIGKIIERYPTVLTYNIEGNMISKVRFLESIGLDRENIGKVIVRSPYIFALSIEDNMRPKVKLLESIGVNKLTMSKLITRCPKIFCLSNDDNVLPKIKYLESIGVEKESMGRLVATCPSILNLSTTLIQQKLDFLQANSFSVKKVVNEFPVYLTYNLELRIKPRHQLIMWLRRMELLKKEYSLCHILQISEKKFLNDFVHCYPQATGVYKTKHDMDDSITQARCTLCMADSSKVAAEKEPLLALSVKQ